MNHSMYRRSDVPQIRQPRDILKPVQVSRCGKLGRRRPGGSYLDVYLQNLAKLEMSNGLFAIVNRGSRLVESRPQDRTGASIRLLALNPPGAWDLGSRACPVLETPERAAGHESDIALLGRKFVWKPHF